MTRDEYAASLKGAFLLVAKDAVIKSLLKTYPILAGGFLNSIIAWIVEKILRLALDQGEVGLFFIYMDLRTDKQAKDFDQAALINYQIQQSGTKEEKANAEAALIAASRDFFKLVH